jgi:glycosyltransferase involved in cell wall biosynthesis
MIPKFLFPGKSRVWDMSQGSLDWYNPFTWLRSAYKNRSTGTFIVEYWTAAVNHMVLFLMIALLTYTKIYNFVNFGVPKEERRFILEMHEIIDPLEKSILPIRLYARLTRRLIMRGAQSIVLHSQHDFDLVEKYPEKKYFIIPHGLYDQYMVRPEAHRSFNILFFGVIREYKGLDTLLEAYHKLECDFRLFIVGEMWDYVKIPNSDRIVRISQYVDDKTTEQVFNLADVLVLPYKRASQSGVAHIGMAFGLPIIYTSVGGIHEALRDYEGGFCVPPNDPEGIRLMLEMVYKKGPIRYPVPEHLKWENIKEKWKDVIES